MNTLKNPFAYIDNAYEDTVILLEDLEFAMSRKQLKEITKLNNEGMGIYEISKKVERHPYEVIIALLHQAKTGRIPLGPIWGFKK